MWRTVGKGLWVGILVVCIARAFGLVFHGM